MRMQSIVMLEARLVVALQPSLSPVNSGQMGLKINQIGTRFSNYHPSHLWPFGVGSVAGPEAGRHGEDGMTMESLGPSPQASRTHLSEKTDLHVLVPQAGLPSTRPHMDPTPWV